MTDGDHNDGVYIETKCTRTAGKMSWVQVDLGSKLTIGEIYLVGAEWHLFYCTCIALVHKKPPRNDQKKDTKKSPQLN